MNALRVALAVNGIDAHCWEQEGPPPISIADRAVQALVIGAAGGAARALSVRGSSGLGKVPLMIVDVPGVEDTPALIRAGVSDATLHPATDDEICKKVWRLVRRGR